MSGPIRIECVVTSGVFSLDGSDYDVENNVWLLGDDTEVLVVDGAHDATAIAGAVAGRRVVGIACTHAHNDHIDAAVDLVERVGGAIYLHPADRMLWDAVHPDRPPGHEFHDEAVLDVAGTRVLVLHTPGHTPGGVCLYAPLLGVVFTGDTLFAGGPGATGRSFSDFPTILESIERRLLALPARTRVLTGHGEETAIGVEAPHLPEWRDRGH